MDNVKHIKQEKWNTLSHAFGVLLGIIGFIILLNNNSNKTTYSTGAIITYGISIIILYTVSTLYHFASNPKLKERFRIADHISIYILIAGTYTPIALITLVNGKGWLIFYIVWGIAVIGTVLKLFFTGKFEFLSLFFYLIMGWLIVFDITYLLGQSSALGIWLFFFGGAFYTLGIFFYAMKRIPYNHLIWHFFVLAGSISHWLYMFFDIV